MIRGEIWLVDFGAPIGSEAGYRRPAVVMQNDDFNRSNIATCTVIPLTSNMILADYTPNVVVPKKGFGIDKRLGCDNSIAYDSQQVRIHRKTIRHA